MKKRIPMLLLFSFLGFALCSCASKDEEKEYTRKFMEEDPEPTGQKKASTLAEIFRKEREKREEKRLKFQDVSRPMDQDSYKIFPWKSESGLRSEQLHEASREGSNSIF